MGLDWRTRLPHWLHINYEKVDALTSLTSATGRIALLGTKNQSYAEKMTSLVSFSRISLAIITNHKDCIMIRFMEVSKTYDFLGHRR